ncbi:MAG: Asp-tRNA(Asn)/Glu-tRNA(Gln) amidotransferase subunit GatA [Bacteroidota bacterium]|nr:Asp-tRNA(Asn)/Glu-tRNA(Gln) amidotransferase subunit GatA [Bacteroidota bacterium]
MIRRTFQNLQKEIQAGNRTVQEEVAEFLKNIEEQKHLNAIIEVYSDEAILKAKAIDEKIKAGTSGKLAGMVIAIKDNICYNRHEVNGGSKILEGFVSQYDATVVKKLLAEDAIFIGRANCDQFAMGSSNETSVHGNVLHPENNSKVPGGSSGGSAVAVAAGLCHVALGSDTGGSIRQPASFCDLVGIRPTYSRVSRYGLFAFASSMDQIGPLANNVYDAAITLEVMAGGDEEDATVSHRPVPEYSKLSTNKGQYNIAILSECVQAEGLDPEIKSAFTQLEFDLIAAGHTVNKVSFPWLDVMVPIYQVLSTAEASSNLSRYAGMTYGYRSPEAKNLEEVINMSRSDGFGKEVKRRIMLGTFVLSEGYYNAYYGKAMQVRRLVKEYTEQMLKEYDFIMLPTAPSTPFAIGENMHDPIQMYLADIFTIQSVLAGNPSISLPLWRHSNGLPFGLQVMGDFFKEDELLSFSKMVLNDFKKNEEND